MICTASRFLTASRCAFWAQVKAVPTQNVRIEDSRKYASYRFERKHLAYWDHQPIPVYAFLVPFDGWPAPSREVFYGIRITEQLVRHRLPDSASAVLGTSDGFSAASLDDDLRQFITRIVFSMPKTSRNWSETASATLGWSKKSPEVAMNTPSRTTRVTLSSEPRCSLAAARTFNAAV